MKPRKTADTDIEDTHDFNAVEADHFEDLEHNNPTKLTALTREIDDLHQQVQAWEGQPMETLKLHRTQMAETLYNTSSTSTHCTPWRGDTALHEHSVFC